MSGFTEPEAADNQNFQAVRTAVQALPPRPPRSVEDLELFDRVLRKMRRRTLVRRIGGLTASAAVVLAVGVVVAAKLSGPDDVTVVGGPVASFLLLPRESPGCVARPAPAKSSSSPSLTPPVPGGSADERVRLPDGWQRQTDPSSDGRGTDAAYAQLTGR